MKKSLRFSLLSLLLLVCGVASAQTTVTFTAGTDVSSATAAGADQVTKDGVTIAVSNGALYRTDNYRCYKSATLTISSTAGNITKVEFTCTANNDSQYGPGNFTATDGTYSYADKVGTWTGEAASVELTATGAQVRMTEIVVTVGGEAGVTVTPPSFSLEAGTYTSAQTLELTADAGCSIYYTTDGTTPTNASTPYTSAITVNETMTVKAIAYDADGNASSVVTKEYVFPETVASIAEYLAKEDGTIVSFTIPLTVFYHSGSYLYVTDGTDNMLLYGYLSETYTNGTIIAAGVTGEKTTYRSLLELVISDYTDSVEPLADEGTAVQPVAVTDLSTITADDQSDFIVVSNAEFDADAKTITVNGNSLAIYSRFSEVTLPESGTYTVTGIVAVYNSNVQLYPTSFSTTPESIGNVEADIEGTKKIYSLDGRKLQAPVKGVNIINGKKMMVK